MLMRIICSVKTFIYFKSTKKWLNIPKISNCLKLAGKIVIFTLPEQRPPSHITKCPTPQNNLTIFSTYKQIYLSVYNNTIAYLVLKTQR